ncbi:hypothetical protein NQZ68_024554 [Dissostichus eleginoides]|nr:hypothetical protein NQZ68_024554 [Dissostichus eleginoides]
MSQSCRKYFLVQLEMAKPGWQQIDLLFPNWWREGVVAYYPTADRRYTLMAVVRRGGELRRREPMDAHQNPDNFHHKTAAMSELKMGTSGFLNPTEL